MKKISIITICLLLISSSAFSLTDKEKEEMVKASKNKDYNIVSKIMLKEYKENCKILKNDAKKSPFKSIEEMVFFYSEAFTKLYIINAKKNGYIYKNLKDIGIIKVRFIMELYDIYKSI